MNISSITLSRINRGKMKFSRILLLPLLTYALSLTALSQFKVWNRLLFNDGKAIAINPMNPNTLYAEQYSRFTASRDRGKTWQYVQGLDLTQAHQILVHPFDSLVIFAAGDGPLLKSTNGGSTWRTMLYPFVIDMESIVFDPLQHDTMYALSRQGKFYRSSDRGESWTTISQVTQSHSSTIAIRPDSANILYLGGYGNSSIYRSTDYGTTWVAVNTVPRIDMSSIVIVRANPLVAYAAGSNSATPNADGLWRTTNGGNSWSIWKLNHKPLSKLAIDQDHPDTIYAGTMGDTAAGVYRTTDGGSTWDFFRKPFFSYNSIMDMKIDPVDPSNVYLSASQYFENGYLGVFKLEEGDAGVVGIARDSATMTPLDISDFSSSDPFVALGTDQYGYEAYRLVGSGDSSFVLHTTSSGYYPKDDTIHFQIDSTIRHDIFLRHLPPIVNGTIQGTVFEDKNGNGVRDSGEAGIPGWRIALSVNHPAIAFTDSNGVFTFSSVAPEYYEVSERVEYGWTQTSPDPPFYRVILNSGDSLTYFNFGNRQRHHVTHVNPFPYSNNSPQLPVITIAFDTSIAEASLSGPNSLTVSGSFSGRHSGLSTFLPGDTGLQFTPTVAFRPGELITVNLASSLTESTLDSISSYSFQFTIGGITPSTGTFHKRISFGVGGNPRSIAAGDFDHDGDIDVVTADYGEAKVSVLLNYGNGTFGNRTDYAVGNGPQGIVVSDLDGDGTLDIVVANNLDFSFSVLKGNGDGTFAPVTTYLLFDHPYALAVADVDGDGDDDILIAQYYSDVAVFTNNGSGAFSRSNSIDVPGGPYAISAADMNADGGIDLSELSFASPSQVIVLRNVGGGTMSFDAGYDVGRLPGAILTADINSDRRPDVMVSNSGSDKISLFFEQPSSSFSPRIDLSTGNNPLGISAADLDGDGHMDLVATHSGSSSFSVFKNDGGGAFSRTDFGAGAGVQSVAVADFDNDGDLDIAFANANENTFSISFNGTVGLNSAVRLGWNLLSIPINTELYSPSLIYPHRASPVFGFHDIYKTIDSLLIGSGYWIKFDNTDTLIYGGFPVLSESVAVRARWNLIGSISIPIPTTAISAIGTSISSHYYGYNDTGYVAVDTIAPGRGYWVKTSDEGTLILSSNIPNTQLASRKSEQIDLRSFNTLRISDSTMKVQTLYFGPAPCDSFSPDFFEMPPPPPANVFDVRFASQRELETYPANLQQDISFRVAVQSAVYPVTVTWRITHQDPNLFFIRTSSNPGGKFSMSGTGTLRMEDSSATGFDLLVAHQSPYPTEYALLQSFPNPFNPTTSFTYRLPEARHVTLVVNDILGRKVATIVDEDRQPGSYTVRWDASAYSSGVYFYTLHAGDFSDTKKMLLIR